MTFDLRTLTLFVAVAEELHFSRAAGRLGMAQPPLSQQIRRLEMELGVQLFNRTSRSVRLTAAGHQLLKGARELLTRRAEVINMTRRAAGGETGTLRLGLSSSSSFGIIGNIIRFFRARYPDVTVQLTELEIDVAASAVATGELDVAILRGPFSHAELRTELLLREPLELVIPSHHPLAAATEIRLATVAEEPFVLFSRHSAPRLHDVITSLCVTAGFSPRIEQEGNSWASVVAMVGAGLGITLAPASAAVIKSTNVLFKPIAGASGEADLIIAYCPDSLPPVGERLIVAAKDALLNPGVPATNL
jgi:DNA-binding transcriptional LysR family regulator